MYAGFFGSWKQKVLFLITFHHPLHSTYLVLWHWSSSVQLDYHGFSLFYSFHYRTPKHLFQVKRKSKELNSPNPIKDAVHCIFIRQNWTSGPLQRDSHHWSRGNATATCLPFGFLPRRNSLLLMQVSYSDQDFHSRQSSSFSSSVGSNPLTGRGLKLLSKRLSAAED